MSGPSHLNPLSRPSLLSIREAAVYLGVPPETVRWWLRVKRLRKVKIGRRVLIRLDDLQDLVAISTEPVTGGLRGPTSAIQKPLGGSRPDKSAPFCPGPLETDGPEVRRILRVSSMGDGEVSHAWH